MGKVAFKQHFEPKLALRGRINEGMGFKELLNRRARIGRGLENVVAGRRRKEGRLSGAVCRDNFQG